ncbi:FliM/FliN family flagellar motor C-terminal domain-containing protein [Sphingomonas sp. DT-204]|uniref:FliM/FliN family flagellar motor C-terminal domain-containing protein n=1 Tax=Sphingomonas sp. DT-204 TaxID=3396166 RepID=UPI003F1A5976
MSLRELAADWSATWFTREIAGCTEAEPFAKGGAVDGDLTALNGELMLAVPATAISTLGVLMFGEPVGEGASTLADRDLIAAAADRATADLRERLAQRFHLSRDAARRPCADVPWDGYCFRIRLDRLTSPLTVIVSEGLLIASVRRRLAPAASDRPLHPIADALAPQQVVLTAMIGTCRVPMHEIAGLDAGDVLVLDRRLDETARLAVDDELKDLPCRVVAGDAALNLALA